MAGGANSRTSRGWCSAPAAPAEGMLISPQHLQQETLYHERLLAARLNAINPYDWGVVEVEFDKNALNAGQLEVAKFAGILPGGFART